ncbi:MAG: hypothetical protein ABIC04_01000 [Nanoarchaeota archaeon]
MKSVTLHVTDLDSYAWYLKLQSISDMEMKGRLLRTEPSNEKMRIGTAWHSVMEDATSGQINKVEKNGYAFSVDCDCKIILPQICEVRAKKDYLIDGIGGINVTLSGKTDGISGNKITDHKLTFNPHPENYFEAYQWRTYLDIFNADSFEYIIYTAKQKDAEITIKEVSMMTFYRYPGMEKDIERGIRDLLGFIKERVPEMIR